MGKLCITLFGRFDVQVDSNLVTNLYPRKTQELLCYLLLNGGTPQQREKLAGTLYGDSTTDQARKSLRQALWQLQTRLESDALQCRLLHVEPDYVQINQQADLTLDLAVFQQAYNLVCEIPGHKLQDQSMHAIKSAVKLYRGDLLEGWYQDWCLFERERLQNMLLKMLQKLMAYCEAHGEYETGLVYGERILSYDPACERAHRQMMRLHYMDGDRTGALHQYDLCVTALRDEIGVEPSERTAELYRQIRVDHLTLDPAPAPAALPATSHQASLNVLNSLRKLRAVLEELEVQIRQSIREDEVTI